MTQLEAHPAAWSPVHGGGELEPRFWTREALAAPDVDLLLRCARDAGYWRSLPKLGGARRPSVARVRLAVGPAAVKRYVERGLFRWLTFARRSRAEREARALELVAAVLPDNPIRVLAWGEARRHGFVRESYLVTAELERSFDLRRVKELAGPLRDQVVAAVFEELPRRTARLHAHGVFARTLRGKNILFQPSSGRIALIDLPYARAVRKLRPRHRVIDLAILSLELRRFLDSAEWDRFVRAYLSRAGELGATDLAGVTSERIDRAAARFGHRTALSAASKALKRRFRHSRVGGWVTGHPSREEPN